MPRELIGISKIVETYRIFSLTYVQYFSEKFIKYLDRSNC